MTIRVVLVDDHPIVLHGLTALFERQDDIEVAATCMTGATALDAARMLQPDVLVMDVKMPGLSGLDLLKAIASEGLPCRCVLLTASISRPEVDEAIRLGARGVVLKEAVPEQLVECVRSVHRGGQWIGADVAAHDPTGADRRADTGGGGEPLTPRELDIVRMIAEGLRNKTIAERVGISEGTVKAHLHNIYEKLAVDGRLQLLVAARERGLI